MKGPRERALLQRRRHHVGQAVNIEQVAQEIVATLVGSIGLVAAVPITTALAALLTVRLTPDALLAHAHSHGTREPVGSFV